MNRNTMILCVVAVVAIVTGATAAVALSNGGPNGNDDTMKVTDMLGVEVEVEKNPDKVACVSRTTYDLLVAFGLGDRVDGVYSAILQNNWAPILYPGSVNHYPYPYQPSSELVMERGIDLVLCPEGYIAEALRNDGIPAMTVCLYGNPNFEPYLYYLSGLAKTLWPDVEGVKEKADAWEAQMSSVISEISEKTSTYTGEKKSLYYVRGDKNKGINYTDTGQSFNEYAFQLLGFDFLGSSFGNNPKPSVEAVLQANPDVVVIGGNFQYTLEDILKTDETWSDLTAVKNGDIHRIGMGFSPMEQIGVFSPVFLADMANKLHPDDFEFDTVSMLKDMCRMYFGTELTSEQAGWMLNGLGSDGKPMA